jgi:hypothetical protein
MHREKLFARGAPLQTTSSLETSDRDGVIGEYRCELPYDKWETEGTTRREPLRVMLSHANIHGHHTDTTRGFSTKTPAANSGAFLPWPELYTCCFFGQP